MRKLVDLDELTGHFRNLPDESSLAIALIEYGIAPVLVEKGIVSKINEATDYIIDKLDTDKNQEGGILNRFDRLIPIFLYGRPIMISHQNPRNEEEKQSRLQYKEELKRLYGEYPSLRALLKSDNLKPLSKKIGEENWRRINEKGMYSAQRGLIIDPCGIVYRYGVMCRGQGVPMQGDRLKLAKVRYITERFLS